MSWKKNLKDNWWMFAMLLMLWLVGMFTDSQEEF